MTFHNPSELLSALAWPKNALDRRGTLTWAAAVGDASDPKTARVSSAAVLVGHDHITLRCRTATSVGPLEPLLEVRWELRGSQPPILVEFVHLGKEQPLDATIAVRAFHDHVLVLAANPEFQAFGPRNPAATSAKLG